jgi:CRISPR-associated protein Csd1
MLPSEPAGRTGTSIKPAFLCDNGGYLLAADTKRGEAKFKEAKALHIKILENVNSKAARAIKGYFNMGVPKAWEQYIGQETAEKARFVFRIDGMIVDQNDADLCRAWNDYYFSNDEQVEAVRCLVTGKMEKPERVHGSVKLRGGQTSGSSLISINKDNFASYGKSKSDPAADVGEFAAFAYVTALNSMLNDEKHRRFLGADTLLYWSEKSDGTCEGLFANMCEPPVGDENAELEGIVKRISVGQPVRSIDFEKKFYILCLSPNAARASVRFFHQSSFGSIIRHIAAHYERLSIIGDGRTKFNMLPLWLILSETTIKKSASDAHPFLGGELLRQIILGGKYPMTLYHAMLGRIRAGEDINQCKAAVVKAILMKNFDEEEVATMALNEQSKDSSYVLGRLFSTLERLQEQANQGSTIRERYFASACANPISVFPTLLKLSFHHMAKLDNTVFFEKRIGELLNRMESEAPFPSALNLEDQGRFILGYYHQRQAFFTKPAKEAAENEQ